ncbi:hypothetical protein [Shinella sp. JR1-6]|uniref:hypothetical protein n=1 Tax=Shinella sp. JR1-6 TaxID=2527671 RepID=UPI001FE03EB7|nr:hypothetical protein [Shinella sp. JR1-6]
MCRSRGQSVPGGVQGIRPTHRTGPVVQLSAESIYFVRFDGNEVTLPLELASLGEMLETTDGGYKLLRFFDTIEERGKWIEWLDAPSKPRVVSQVSEADEVGFSVG